MSLRRGLTYTGKNSGNSKPEKDKEEHLDPASRFFLTEIKKVEEEITQLSQSSDFETKVAKARKSRIANRLQIQEDLVAANY